MFQSIFNLASRGLGDRAADDSDFMATAIVDGAIIPFFVGLLADPSDDLSIAFVLPALCYAVIAGFGYHTLRKAISSISAA